MLCQLQEVVRVGSDLLSGSFMVSPACSRRLRAINVKSVSPPSCQHLASGDGRFSQRIQSLASTSTCPLMHFAYIICSFNSGSPGLIRGEAIFGMKNLHHGTVIYLPYCK